MSDNVISEARDNVDFEQWLHDREYEGLLTRGEKEKLKELAAKVPKGLLSGVGKLLVHQLKAWLTGSGAMG